MRDAGCCGCWVCPSVPPEAAQRQGRAPHGARGIITEAGGWWPPATAQGRDNSGRIRPESVAAADKRRNEGTNLAKKSMIAKALRTPRFKVQAYNRCKLC